jgi:DNA replication protein DnaC
MQVRGFAANYPLDSRGLILVGSIGTGKTHLAVGALKVVIAERGAQGLFCDYRELLRLIQNSYNPEVFTTELEILNPVMNAEVLLLDDLGAIRPTEWVWDTVSLVLNSRYNSLRTTIITTNYPALPPGARCAGRTSVNHRNATTRTDAPKEGREVTLRADILNLQLRHEIRRHWPTFEE